MNAEQERVMSLGNEVNGLLDTSGVSQALSHSASTGDGFFMGLTLWGLVFGLFFSLVGFAYFVYAKKQGRLIVGLCGVCLATYTLFIVNTTLIIVLGCVLSLLPFALYRFGVDL